MHTFPVCIQCGTYIKAPAEPWTAIIDGRRYGPIHKRCMRGLGRRLMAYPCHCGSEPESGSVVLAVDPASEQRADSRSTPAGVVAPPFA
jgi:hypothetical protein